MRRRDFIALLSWVVAERPLAVRAQQSNLPVIGYLSGGEANERVPLTLAFKEGLGELGLVEGRNVAIEYRWAEGNYDRLPALAADLVNRHVTVLTAADAPAAQAAKTATRTIPIAFQTGADALQSGLVKSLDHPEANLTGINEIAGPLAAKRIGLLRELLPDAKKFGFLVNPSNANAALDEMTAEGAARQLGLQIEPIKASREAELISNLSDRPPGQIDGLVVNSDLFLTAHRELILSFCERKSLPAIYPFREYAAAGGLMSYGVSLPTIYRQLGRYTAELLKGAKPQDLPVAQPTKFDFVVNLKAATSQRIAFPPGLIAIADEVIE
jgi:putative tryptophan/tyrosine transport system substrate-binding protein